VIKRPYLLSYGSHISIDCFVYISCGVSLGDWVHIAPFVSIIGGERGRLTMGNFCALASGARIICATDDWLSSHVCSFIPAQYKHVINEPVIIKDFCGVATNGVVMPGVTMAMGSILGVGSVLTENTQEWGVYVGSPARLVKYRENKEILNSAKILGYEI